MCSGKNATLQITVGFRQQAYLLVTSMSSLSDAEYQKQHHKDIAIPAGPAADNIRKQFPIYARQQYRI